MKYKEYYASICYEDETSTFYGEIEDIDDLVTFEADTVAGLKKEFKNAVEEYLDLCKRNNMEPNKPYKGTFNVRIKPELHRKAVKASKILNMSLNQFVEKAISDKVNAK